MRVGVKEAARRRLDAITLAAVVDGVEVQLQNLILRVTIVQLDGQRRFPQFALDGWRRVWTDEHLFDQLLADRAPALGDAMV